MDPFLQELRSCLERHGAQPYDLPISWSDNKDDPSGDAELFGVVPATATAAVQLRSGARVTRLHVNPSGREVKGVEACIAAKTGCSSPMWWCWRRCGEHPGHPAALDQ